MNIIRDSCVLKMDNWMCPDKYKNSLRRLCALDIYKPLKLHYNKQALINVQILDIFFPNKLNTSNVFGLNPMNLIIHRVLLSSNECKYNLVRHQKKWKNCLENFRWNEYQLPEEYNYCSSDISDDEDYKYFDDDFSCEEGFEPKIVEYADEYYPFMKEKTFDKEDIYYDYEEEYNYR